MLIFCSDERKYYQYVNGNTKISKVYGLKVQIQNHFVVLSLNFVQFEVTAYSNCRQFILLGQRERDQQLLLYRIF